MTPARLVASGLGIGFLRPAPGSWGSALVLPLALLPGWAILLAAALLTAAGFWALARLNATEEDPGWVVVDEAAGQALALAFVPAALGVWGVLLAFGLFRLLDILKPGPVGWMDRQPGALGVMGDDLVAGGLAAALLLGIGWGTA
ncbi:MAG: phosphatidylglycerophosphatase A [Acetobacteraceae bacterium]|nr:phosphatidylglycerophosphatase A [Acetobacteraceae bacterium]